MTDADLELWKEQAKRDDWYIYFVGSDIREMIGEIERLRAENAKLQTLVDKWTWP